MNMIVINSITKLDMKQRATRRIMKKRKSKRKITRKQRGGGESCYKTNAAGNIERTWSCTTACGKDGECEPFD